MKTEGDQLRPFPDGRKLQDSARDLVADGAVLLAFKGGGQWVGLEGGFGEGVEALPEGDPADEDSGHGAVFVVGGGAEEGDKVGCHGVGVCLCAVIVGQRDEV